MKQLDVEIMGQRYLLTCPEGGEAAMLKAVERVDTAMCKIRDAGKVRARDRIAVLASLNLAFELSEALAQPPATAPVVMESPPFAEADVSLLLERLDQALMSDNRLI